MGEGVTIALRFGIYVDLMLLFGLAAYPQYAGRLAAFSRPTFLALAALGMVFSVAGFCWMTAQMAGVPVAALDRETLRFVLLETAAGTAFLVRTAALAGAFALAFTAARKPSYWLVGTFGGLALATLAWTGHAAITEGDAGTLHRLADIAHLLAAAMWLGALAMLLKSLLPPAVKADDVVKLRQALTRFGFAGSVLVATMVVTGLVNGWMIVGPENLAMLPETLYGQLLITKLLLFGAMLGLAALNRWRLTPRLERAEAVGGTAAILRALKFSIGLEAGAAVLILALVAWLGTLAPPSAL